MSALAQTREPTHAHGTIHTPTRTYTILPARRASLHRRADRQGAQRWHAGHRRDRPRRDVRHKGVLQQSKQEKQQAARRDQGEREGAQAPLGQERPYRRGAAANRGAAGEDCRGESRHLQAHHRLRVLLRSPRATEQAGLARRPQRLALDRVGEKQERLQEPDQAGLAVVDRGLLWAPTYRQGAAREVSRRPDCLLRLLGRRDSAADHEGTDREGGRVDQLVQAAFRSGLLPGDATPRDARPQRRLLHLSPSGGGEQGVGRAGA